MYGWADTRFGDVDYIRERIAVLEAELVEITPSNTLRWNYVTAELAGWRADLTYHTGTGLDD